jgi:argininosuccinate lyase
MAMGIMNMINELFHNAAYQDINEVADAPVKEFENSLELAESAVALMSQTIKSMDISRQRVSEIALNSGTTTTELADELVRLYGISFRQAHSITAGFVRSGYDKDALRNIFQEKTDRSLKLSDKEIDEILSIERFISVRKVSGGPSEEGMKVVLKELEKYISAFSFSLDKKEKDILSAQQNLKTEYDII